MKALLNKYPTTSRFVLAILLSCLALFINGLLNKDFVKQYFPYVSCMLLFVATWFLYKTDKQSLKAIGLNFSLRNLSFFTSWFVNRCDSFIGSEICARIIHW